MIVTDAPAHCLTSLKRCIPKRLEYKCGITGQQSGTNSSLRFLHTAHRSHITFVIHSCNAIPFFADTKPVVGDFVRETNNVTETTVV